MNSNPHRVEPQPDPEGAYVASKRREDYWSIVIRQFRKNRIAVVGLVLVLFLFALALSADLIANDMPLVMNYEGATYFPVLNSYGVWLGLTRWEPQFLNVRYKDFAERNFGDADWAVFPPIKYSPTETDLFSVIQPPSRVH